MPTKVSCSLIEDTCVDDLKSSFVFLFDSDVSRDAHFQAIPTQLVNDGNRQSMAFVGTAALRYQYWDGPNEPTSYDNSNWKDIPIASAIEGDVHYWGDKTVEKSMRARIDKSTGYLIFERLIGGSWVEKFRISDSVATSSIKFFESTTIPVVQSNELGLYARLLKDSEHGDAQILRPIFIDPDHTQYLHIAASPDGSLRVPQNTNAALADPDNVPLVYKRVILEGQGPQVRDALSSLTGDDRLDASHIKDLPDGNMSVVNVANDLTITTSNYKQYAGKVVSLIRSDQNTQKIILPRIADIQGELTFTFVNSRSGRGIADISPLGSDKINNTHYYRVGVGDAVTITKPDSGLNWLVTSGISHTIDGGRISG